MKLKPCPFCGATQDTDWEDTMYPVFGWKDEDIGGDGTLVRCYVPIYDPEKHGMVYNINCASTYGGCDASITGDSEEEVIAKWNKRKE